MNSVRSDYTAPQLYARSFYLVYCDYKIICVSRNCYRNLFVQFWAIFEAIRSHRARVCFNSGRNKNKLYSKSEKNVSVDDDNIDDTDNDDGNDDDDDDDDLC